MRLLGQERLGDAARALLCEGTAPPDQITADLLRELHPQQPQIQTLPPAHHTPLTANNRIILDAFQSFPTGSACGSDGLRAQHLLDMVSVTQNIERNAPLKSLTAFVNKALAGSLPDDFAPFFASAPLTALL